MNEQELQDAQDLIPRPPKEDKVAALMAQIGQLNLEINDANERIAFHHQQGDHMKEHKATLEARQEKMMKELREALGEVIQHK